MYELLTHLYTSIFRKIFEKAMLSRLESVLQIYNILSLHKHGLWIDKSTMDAILQIPTKTVNYTDKKSWFLDLKKSFDNVHNELKKLKIYGIRRIEHNLFKTWLFNRKLKSTNVLFR